MKERNLLVWLLAAFPLHAALTPPMGWSSWNSFSNTVDSVNVSEQAKAMVSTGMKAAGYRYVNIDEGWWLGDRDRNGNIIVNAEQWPALQAGEHAGDMSNIVRYIHSLGLKAGIYTDAGESGCSFYGPDLGPPKPHTGSEGHYEQDFLQFAKWGFDYVKVDWCGGNKENLDPATQYREIARAIAKAETEAGRALFFSICNWGKQSPWTWAPGIGNVVTDIWRTSGDIVAPIVANSANSGRRASFRGMLGNFDAGIHPEAQHTGFFNDPDMMVLGMPGLSDAQNRVHMSLWAISGAPLLAGADLTKLSDTTRTILTNSEVIAVDQDALGLQCVKAAEPTAGVQVWVKRLAGAGQRAVVLLNRTKTEAAVTIKPNELGLSPARELHVRDLWAHRDEGPVRSYTTTVPAEHTVMVLVRGGEDKGVEYKAANNLTFADVLSPGRSAYLRIAYSNDDRAPRLAELRVNGATGTAVVFPPAAEGAITVEANFKAVGEKNTVTFSAPCGPAPVLHSITVLSGAP
ncbi:MAG TPA: alpha-galactosidase [Bryobacteraceae bacterium]|nr:alpha-galactosidase [Bryobacteraceae bacterium]